MPKVLSFAFTAIDPLVTVSVGVAKMVIITSPLEQEDSILVTFRRLESQNEYDFNWIQPLRFSLAITDPCSNAVDNWEIKKMTRSIVRLPDMIYVFLPLPLILRMKVVC